MFIPREETKCPGYRELNTTDPFNEMSTLSSHTDSGHGRSVDSAGYYEELPDLCRYPSDMTWKRRNQQMINRSRERDHDSYQYQPKVDVNTFCHSEPIPVIITGTKSNIIEHPLPTEAMTSKLSLNYKPLLPTVSTLPKIHSLSEV
ncbi:hypothetical protein Ahia01_000724000 [Argonauta hians]